MNNREDNITSIAHVGERVDVNLNGTFQATVDYLDDDEVPINYTSPYASNGAGAFIAVPEKGTTILVCSPCGSDEWFYLGATFVPESGQVIGAKIPDGQVSPVSRVDPELYKAQGAPMRVNLKTISGAGLTMSEEYNSNFINKKTELKSTVNKKLTLNDSPAIDSIIMDSGNGAKITVSDDPQNQSIPSRAIQLESVGPQKHINIESQTDMVVVDGRELQFLNNSTGANAPEGEPNKAGNVNIQSKWKDVNVFTQAEQGRIFIECINTNGNNQVIQIETKGSGGAIRLKTQGRVEIEASEVGVQANSIDVKANTAINMEAPTINLNGVVNAPLVNAAFNGNITGTAGFAATAGLAVPGTPVPIVVPTPVVPPAIPNIGDSENYYGTEGITTY
jgi:hypothetical protein